MLLLVCSCACGNKVAISMTWGSDNWRQVSFFFFHRLLYILWKRTTRLNTAPRRKNATLVQHRLLQAINAFPWGRVVIQAPRASRLHFLHIPEVINLLFNPFHFQCQLPPTPNSYHLNNNCYRLTIQQQHKSKSPRFTTTPYVNFEDINQ